MLVFNQNRLLKYTEQEVSTNFQAESHEESRQNSANTAVKGIESQPLRRLSCCLQITVWYRRPENFCTSVCKRSLAGNQR